MDEHDDDFIEHEAADMDVESVAISSRQRRRDEKRGKNDFELRYDKKGKIMLDKEVGFFKNAITFFRLANNSTASRMVWVKQIQKRDFWLNYKSMMIWQKNQQSKTLSIAPNWSQSYLRWLR